jgi:hypothetical protein
MLKREFEASSFLFSLERGNVIMKKVEGFKYCEFVYLGINKVRILKWYFINILTFNYWLIIVITPAAGKDGGKHIDIYNLRRRIEKGRLLNKLKENNRGEEIYLFAFFNLVGLAAFFISLKKKGVLPGQHPLLKKSIANCFLSQ